MKAEYIDHMGDDLRVVNAARVSFNKESDFEFETFNSMEEAEKFAEEVNGSVDIDYISSDNWMGGYPVDYVSQKDIKLINYLAKHGHWTPFSHPQITIRETVPIFVARQRFKHMVGFTYNEVSRRYVDDTPEFYRPNGWRSRPEGSMKQGSGSHIIKNPSFPWVDHGSQGTYEDFLEICKGAYDALLEQGVAPEQARMVLPQSMYTSYYVTGSLAAWARAYKQRIDSHAQIEIQDLAKQWDGIIAPLFPVSWKALTGK